MGRKTFGIRALFVAVAVSAASVAHGQSNGSGIGYPSPLAAMQALRARPDVAFSIQNGWIIASDKANMTIWSFSPTCDPTFPTAVKRQVMKSAGEIYIDTNILCGGTQAACDALSAQFKALNQAAKQNLNSPLP
jgi:hypothetical protein